MLDLNSSLKEVFKMIGHQDIAVGKSLDEVNGSIAVPAHAGFWKMLRTFTGPGCLIAVGYMDPGNWITSISGGAQYRYRLLAVVLVANLIAMLLQTMATRLGMVTGQDLAQLTRAHTSQRAGIVLWVIAELAIMATDIAEIIGSGIAMQLLFGIPIIIGILITALDVLLLLGLMRLGFRKIEAIIATLVLVILVVFAYEVFLAKPDLGGIISGYVPSTAVLKNHGMLYLTLGIVGATVMPHDLYLGSSISQSRQVDRTNRPALKKALHFATIDSNVQLFIAFIVNSLLLILGAAMFYGTKSSVGRFDALFHSLNNPAVVGAIASPMLSMLFAVALLASGQSATITGTLAGQIVMEGFIRIKVPIWVQRLLTRLLSMTPVLIFAIIYHGNEDRLESLLTFSQVFLSIALPFAVIPLVIFTSNKHLMGEFTNRPWVRNCAWLAAGVLIILNVYLVVTTLV